MKWTINTLYVCLFFLPIVLLFNYIDPYSARVPISGASAYLTILAAIALIVTRLMERIPIYTRILAFLIFTLLCNVIFMQLLLFKHEELYWRNGFLFPIAVLIGKCARKCPLFSPRYVI